MIPAVTADHGYLVCSTVLLSWVPVYQSGFPRFEDESHAPEWG